MEYIIKDFCGGTLGEPPQNKRHLDETAIKHTCNKTFNNCDYTGTITIKGAYRQRSLESKIPAQYLLFIKIKNIISDYCQYYIINYEFHKCSEWIHSHFVFRPKFRSKVPKMRQEIFKLIEGSGLKRKTYRHRILIEKPYNISNFIEYIFKDYEVMHDWTPFKSHYKLISQPIICPSLLNEGSTTERKDLK